MKDGHRLWRYLGDRLYRTLWLLNCDGGGVLGAGRHEARTASPAPAAAGPWPLHHRHQEIPGWLWPVLPLLSCLCSIEGAEGAASQALQDSEREHTERLQLLKRQPAETKVSLVWGWGGAAGDGGGASVEAGPVALGLGGEIEPAARGGASRAQAPGERGGAHAARAGGWGFL